MKLLLIAIAAALIGAGASYAGQSMWWKKNTRTYRCAGTEQFVICHSGAQKLPVYRVMIDRNVVWLGYGGKLVFECTLGTPAENCQDYRR